MGLRLRVPHFRKAPLIWYSVIPAVFILIEVITSLATRQTFNWLQAILPVLTFLGIMLFIEESRPWRWWKLVAGIDVKVGERNRYDAWCLDDTKNSKIDQWCIDQKFTYVKINDMKYRFLYKSDATLFKLTWS